MKVLEKKNLVLSRILLENPATVVQHEEHSFSVGRQLVRFLGLKGVIAKDVKCVPIAAMSDARGMFVFLFLAALWNSNLACYF